MEINSDGIFQIGVSRGKNDSGIAASCSTEYDSLPLCLPYGIISIPPQGESIGIISGGGSGTKDVCIGAVNNTSSITEGEIMIRSKGGAYILLKNNGQVIINGLVYGGA